MAAFKKGLPGSQAARLFPFLMDLSLSEPLLSAAFWVLTVRTRRDRGV